MKTIPIGNDKGKQDMAVFHFMSLKYRQLLDERLNTICLTMSIISATHLSNVSDTRFMMSIDKKRSPRV